MYDEISPGRLSELIQASLFDCCCKEYTCCLSSMLNLQLLMALTHVLDDALYGGFQVSHIASLQTSVSNAVSELRCSSTKLVMFRPELLYTAKHGSAVELYLYRQTSGDLLMEYLQHFDDFNQLLHSAIGDQIALEVMLSIDGWTSTTYF